jgi:hypothetical protein
VTLLGRLRGERSVGLLFLKINKQKWYEWRERGKTR